MMTTVRCSQKLHIADLHSHYNFGSTDNAFRLPYVLEFRPSPEFDYDAGKKKLINVQLASDAGTRVIFLTPGENEGYEDDEDGNKLGLTNRQGKVLKLSSLVDMDSRLSIGCAGAVLTYIGRRKAVEYLPAGVNANSSFRISTVETFSIKDTMYFHGLSASVVLH